MFPKGASRVLGKGASEGQREVGRAAWGQGLQVAIGIVAVQGLWASATWEGTTGANVGDGATCIV